MTERESAASIDETASVWASRIDRGLSPVENSELDAWIAGDERRLGALSRAEAAWIHAERAGSLGHPPHSNDAAIVVPVEEVPRASLLSRRSFFVGGGAAMAATIAAAVTIPSFLPHEKTWKTAAGEIRTFKLGDGSSVTLDTASEMAVSTSRGRNLATLVNGRAFFTIAPAATDPFELRTRDVALVGNGSAFSVSAIEHMTLEVIVTAGRVAVDQASTVGRVPLAVLRRGMELALPFGKEFDPSMVRNLPENVLAGAAQWQSGLLTFAGDTLGQAADMFNRYGGVQISIPDRALAAEPISGVFRNSDAADFAIAIATTLSAKTIRAGNTISIVRQ